MTAPLAFRCCYSDWKLIRTRGIVQIIFEIPLADADAAYNVLGGMPDASRENWFAVAPLKPPPAEKEKPAAEPQPAPDKPLAGAKRTWDDMPPSQKAGIRSHDPRFEIFLQEEYAEEWREHDDSAECIRAICCIRSRSELGTDHRKLVLWNQLDRHFDTWLLKEKVGA